MLQKEVYLFERLDSTGRDVMGHLKAVVFLRPITENVQRLAEELKKPNYGEYNIFFSNIVTNDKLELLAMSDEHEVVKQVQEFYADFYAINQELFTFGLEHPITDASGQNERVVEGFA
jgi:vacuolar protein sorting-associated protein 45